MRVFSLGLAEKVLQLMNREPPACAWWFADLKPWFFLVDGRIVEQDIKSSCNRKPIYAGSENHNPPHCHLSPLIFSVELFYHQSHHHSISTNPTPEVLLSSNQISGKIQASPVLPTRNPTDSYNAKATRTPSLSKAHASWNQKHMHAKNRTYYEAHSTFSIILPWWS